MKILITGAGGPAGICFAKSLSEVKNIELFGADALDSKIGREFVKTFYTIPFASDPFFLDSMQKIIETEKIDFLIPLVDEELSIISANRGKLGCEVLISPPETLALTTDKGKLYDALSSFLPKRYSDSNVFLPVFVKPRIGRGSRDTHIVYDKSELDLYKENKYIIQEVLEGPEVTVDTLFDFNGELLIAVPRIRKEVCANISIRGEVIESEEIMSKVKKISEILKFIGPINFQFMNSQDGFKLIEINARSSGGMGITVNSGVDIPKLVYELIKNRTISDIPSAQVGEFPNFEEIIERQRQKALNKTQ